MLFEFREIPVDQSWVLDGFPITLNQAKLLEEALTGYKRKFLQLKKKKEQMPTLALDPSTSTEVSLLPSALDFVILLDISDNSSLARTNDIIGKRNTLIFFKRYTLFHNQTCFKNLWVFFLTPWFYFIFLFLFFEEQENMKLAV